LANSNVFFVPATSLVTASVTLQTAAAAAITYSNNHYFMGVGGNVQTLERQIEILDGWEWLCTLAMASMDAPNNTPAFPRPAAGRLTALSVEMLYAHWNVKHNITQHNNVLFASNPFVTDNDIFFGLSGSATLQFNQGTAMGSHGLRIAFEAMKKFALIGPSIWT
jgi:hypothetical protein